MADLCKPEGSPQRSAFQATEQDRGVESQFGEEIWANRDHTARTCFWFFYDSGHSQAPSTSSFCVCLVNTYVSQGLVPDLLVFSLNVLSPCEVPLVMAFPPSPNCCYFLLLYLQLWNLSGALHSHPAACWISPWALLTKQCLCLQWNSAATPNPLHPPSLIPWVPFHYLLHPETLESSSLHCPHLIIGHWVQPLLAPQHLSSPFHPLGPDSPSFSSHLDTPPRSVTTTHQLVSLPLVLRAFIISTLQPEGWFLKPKYDRVAPLSRVYMAAGFSVFLKHRIIPCLQTFAHFTSAWNALNNPTQQAHPNKPPFSSVDPTWVPALTVTSSRKPSQTP